MFLRMFTLGLIAFLLYGCSYDHGVRRILDFETEVTDFICISKALQNLGYQIESYQGGVSYYSNKVPVSGGFNYLQNNGEGLPRYKKRKLEHRVGLGSGPISCDVAKRTSVEMSKIESTVFGACGLLTLNIEERLDCSR